MNIIELVMIIIAMISGAIGLNLGLNLKQRFKKLKDNIFPTQFNYKINISNPKEMEKILRWFPKLSIQEKQLLLQQAFGRPVRFMIGMDKDGTSWFEGCTPLNLSEEEWGFHFEQTREVDKSIG